MDEKRRQWEQIKAEAPGVADWLGDLSKAFGKPTAVAVELVASGTVIEVGVFDSPKSVFIVNNGVRRYGR